MDIVLIGMPGCGKTTLGKMLSKRLGMEFADADAEIERYEGRSIPDIFATDGEAYFRKVETECLKNMLGLNRVISTGGGVVVTEENHTILKNSGAAVVFIDRPTECIMNDIKTADRPLLAEGKERIKRLYDERYDKYMSLCNIRVVNDKTKEDVISGIIEEVKSYENNGD